MGVGWGELYLCSHLRYRVCVPSISWCESSLIYVHVCHPRIYNPTWCAPRICLDVVCPHHFPAWGLQCIPCYVYSPQFISQCVVSPPSVYYHVPPNPNMYTTPCGVSSPSHTAWGVCVCVCVGTCVCVCLSHTYPRMHSPLCMDTRGYTHIHLLVCTYPLHTYSSVCVCVSPAHISQ